MVRKLGLIFIIAVAILAASFATVEAKSDFHWRIRKTNHGYVTEFYDGNHCVQRIKTKRKLCVKIVGEKKLNRKKIVTRCNRYILVSKIKGQVINDELDGETKCGNYISYKCVDGAWKWDFMTTYCIYGNNNYEDDVVNRVDYIRR